MTRTYYTYPITDIKLLKRQMLSWANRFSICCLLDNHSYNAPYHTAEFIAGVGAIQFFNPSKDFFSSLSSFVSQANDYIFGHFNYELKDKIEPGLSSSHIDPTGFPLYCLFIPEVVLFIEENTLTIGTMSNGDALKIYNEILQTSPEETQNEPVKTTPRISRSQYIDDVKNLQRHIQLGDCYVINYCQEFYATAVICPAALYQQLAELSPNPFGAFYKLTDKYLLCASPERFLKKEGNTLISQPIKGTAPRHHSDKMLDDLNKASLSESKKDRSENVMVVDLVRNDLSKICSEGSVTVSELFGIYSFPNVHQMISTVTGHVSNEVLYGEILKALFPMGSMTGAPKHRVMELTEQYEHTRRGIYSGTVGYISPTGDFDFNVVIRSLVYNAASQFLSYHVGGAITAYSTPEAEYEESMLKGKAIATLLSGQR